MLMFTHHHLFDHFWFTLIHGPNIPGSFEILFFTALDFSFITSHIHNWVVFLLWLCLFIPSGAISPLFSSSILGTYWPGELIFQHHTHLPFYTVHGVLKPRILKWFAIPFSSGPLFFRALHQDPSILGGPTQHGSQFHWVTQYREKRAEDEVRTGVGQRQLSGGACQPPSWGGREHPKYLREGRWCQGWGRAKTSSGSTCQSSGRWLWGAPQLTPAYVANQMLAPETKVKPQITQMRPSTAEAYILHHHLCLACNRGSSWSKDWTLFFHIVGRHFTNLATREALGIG